MDSLRPEDEYADRDDLGLEPVVGSEDPKVREKETFVKYFKMLIIFIPLTGLAFACGTFALSKFALGFGEIMEAKFRFAHQYQLGYVFLGVWAVGMTRTTLSLLANAARSGARLGRPDQHIYRIMGPQYKEAPYVLMTNTGPQGRFNRVQRAVYNTDESMPLFVANVILATSMFGPVVLLPLLLYCYGRISFAVKYGGSLQGRSGGFLPSVIGEKWMEGLVLFSGIMALF